ncbi:MAG TPA: hypothetical protein VGJ91_19990 [Polyangiaceae bacterium]|jgi:hypothetical protein
MLEPWDFSHAEPIDYTAALRWCAATVGRRRITSLDCHGGALVGQELQAGVWRSCFAIPAEPARGRALSLRLTESEQTVAKLRRELDEALAALSAVNVLDAWAQKHRLNVTPPVERQGKDWSCVVLVRGKWERFTRESPARVRAVVASVLLAEDPELAHA